MSNIGNKYFSETNTVLNKKYQKKKTMKLQKLQIIPLSELYWLLYNKDPAPSLEDLLKIYQQNHFYWNQLFVLSDDNEAIEIELRQTPEWFIEKYITKNKWLISNERTGQTIVIKLITFSFNYEVRR